MKFMDFCAGIGGGRLGLEAQGVGGCDVNKR